MAVLNFGSLNIDHVYHVDHVVRPGETLAGRGYRVFAGGKGANQSAALALAGAPVAHAGRVGRDGRWLVDGLSALGVDVAHVVVDEEEPTGHAVIQVEEESGENAIVLFPGCNQRIAPDQVRTCLSSLDIGDILLLQNEINGISEILSEAAGRGLRACLNPAPYGPEVADYPLDRVDLLIVNRTEAVGLCGDPAVAEEAEVGQLLAGVRSRVPEQTEILLTLGAGGAVLDGPAGRLCSPALSAGAAVDTTGAGDTFIGYFLAARLAGAGDETCLRRAAAAASLCVTRPGARDAIPRRDEVDCFLGGGTP
ncbi:MAG: ribokinase [Gemmatimonadaceae bacterium]|nr:ribokinase [Gemmatimonadaceae bacterium]